MSGNDWINVRLTEFAEQYVAQSGGGPLRVHDGRFECSILPGETMRVTRAFDWERVLKPIAIAGQAMFEIADEVNAEIESQKTPTTEAEINPSSTEEEGETSK